MESIDLLQNDVRLLGTSGSKTKECGTSCLQVSKNIIIDAGNIIQTLGDDAINIEHIFLTHSHLDHIIDIAFLVENNYHKLTKPIKIYALESTLKAISDHLFNNTIWPNFTEIKLKSSNNFAIQLYPIELGKIYDFDDVNIKAIEVCHSVPTCAYVVEKKFFSLLYAPDTYLCDTIFDEINQNPKIDSLLIDFSFPSSLDALAKVSKHLTPELLASQLHKLKREIHIYPIHLKDAYEDEIIQEIQNSTQFSKNIKFLSPKAYLKKGLLQKPKDQSQLEMLTALAKENNLSHILEQVLTKVMQEIPCEGGTIYLKENHQLKFEIVINKKLGIYNTKVKNWAPIELFTPTGSNLSNVSALCANKQEIINIADVYHAKGFDFEGMKKFDKANNYRSKSMLLIPMIDHEDELIGVLQMINKYDSINQSCIPFSKEDVEIVKSYSAYAAIAITKNRLISDLEKLLYSFLESIAVAMDAKSPFGYGHINRVAKLMNIITEGINKDQTTFKDIHFDEDALSELSLAAWMHDIGKISTPEYVLDKSTKLETIHNRISEIKERFERIKLFLQRCYLEQEIAYLQGDESINLQSESQWLQDTLSKLDDDLAFIKQKNLPVGYTSDDDIKRLQDIAKIYYDIDGQRVYLLSKDELTNLSIRYGTLNDKERAIINEHAKVSNDMLNRLVFPKKYAKIPIIAGMHHEKLNGKGYPNGVKEEKIPFEARLLAIADIFEALTAHDRPYKRPKTLQESYKILDQMVQNHEIDGEIVNFLKKSGIFENYAKKFLLKEQI